MEEMEYEMEEIINARRKNGSGPWEYLVKWVDWPVEDSTWEPVSAFQGNCVPTLFAWLSKGS